MYMYMIRDLSMTKYDTVLRWPCLEEQTYRMCYFNVSMSVFWKLYWIDESVRGL